MFWYSQIETVTKKRTRKFYKNYISRRKNKIEMGNRR